MENVYGNSYTNIPNTNSTTYWPADDVGGNVTATGGTLATATTVVIKSIVVRVFNSGGSFTLKDHSGNVIALFTPTAAGTFSFGKDGIRINSGWSLTQEATAGGQLMVVWKRLS